MSSHGSQLKTGDIRPQAILTFFPLPTSTHSVRSIPKALFSLLLLTCAHRLGKEIFCLSLSFKRQLISIQEIFLKCNNISKASVLFFKCQRNENLASLPSVGLARIPGHLTLMKWLPLIGPNSPSLCPPSELFGGQNSYLHCGTLYCLQICVPVLQRNMHIWVFQN